MCFCDVSLIKKWRALQENRREESCWEGGWEECWGREARENPGTSPCHRDGEKSWDKCGALGEKSWDKPGTAGALKGQSREKSRVNPLGESREMSFSGRRSGPNHLLFRDNGRRTTFSRGSSRIFPRGIQRLGVEFGRERTGRNRISRALSRVFPCGEG